MIMAACQSDKQDSPCKKITINLQEGDLPTLNPYVGLDLRSRCLFLALYEPLMRRTPEGGLELAAAEKVEIDPTKTIYTFHIRPHEWSNGQKVSSHHFADAWKYALTPGTPCGRADLLYVIKNAELVKKGKLPLEDLKIFAPDANTLVVELENPISYFLELVATSFFAPLYENTIQDPTLFNGPFILKERTLGQNLIFAKNPLYWDEQNVDIDEIDFNIVEDPLTAYHMYQKGEIDLVGDPFSTIPFDLLSKLESQGKLHSKIISRIAYLLINTTQPPMNNVSLRKALSFSIDRNKLTRDLMIGNIPTLSLLPGALAIADHSRFPKEDPKLLFQQALNELEMTKEEFPTLLFSHAELTGQKPLAEFLQNQWKETLGIRVEVDSFQWNNHISNLRTKNYQIGPLHITTVYQDPMFFFDFFKDRSSFFNYTGWEGAHFRSQLDLANQTLDPMQRKTILEEAEVELFEAMPAIPLFTQNLQYLVQDRIDLAISDLGIYDFKKTKIKSPQ